MVVVLDFWLSRFQGEGLVRGLGFEFLNRVVGDLDGAGHQLLRRQLGGLLSTAFALNEVPAGLASLVVVLDHGDFFSHIQGENMILRRSTTVGGFAHF